MMPSVGIFLLANAQPFAKRESILRLWRLTAVYSLLSHNAPSLDQGEA